MKRGDRVEIEITSHFTKMSKKEWFYTGYDKDKNRFEYSCKHNKLPSIRKDIEREGIEPPYTLTAKIASVKPTEFDYKNYKVKYLHIND